jgi:hypothetical protein
MNAVHRAQATEAGRLAGSPLADIVDLLQMVHDLASDGRPHHFFAGHPAASPCPASGPLPPTSAWRSRPPVASAVESRSRPYRRRLSSNDKMLAPIPPILRQISSIVVPLSAGLSAKAICSSENRFRLMASSLQKVQDARKNCLQHGRV